MQPVLREMYQILREMSDGAIDTSLFPDYHLYNKLHFQQEVTPLREKWIRHGPLILALILL